MKQIGRLVSRLNGVAIFLGSIVVLLTVVHVTLDVSLRYLLNAPLPATIIFVSTFYMVLIVFLPLGAVEEDGGHISVEIVHDLMPTAVQWVLRLMSVLLSLGVFGMLALRSWEEAMRRYTTGSFVIESDMKIPIWMSYFVLPAGFALIALVLAYRLVCQLTGHRPALRGSADGNVMVADRDEGV